MTDERNEASRRDDESIAIKSKRNEIEALAIFLAKSKLKETLKSFLKETNCDCDDELQSTLNAYLGKEADEVAEHSSLPATETEASEKKTQLLRRQQQEFSEFYNFIDQSLDRHKHELAKLLLPILTQIYYGSLNESQRDLAQAFLREYLIDVGYFEPSELQKLMPLQLYEQFERRYGKTVIRISQAAHASLRYFLKSHEPIVQIINEHINISIYVGETNELKVQQQPADNVPHIYLGRNYQMMRKPDENNSYEEGDADDADKAQRRKRRGRRPNIQVIPKRHYRWHPNAPPDDRVPMPTLRPMERLKCLKGSYQTQKRVTLGRNQLPSICCYSILNSQRSVTCTEFSDDSSMLACGFANSYIRIWSLTPSKLHKLKPADQLQKLDFDLPDIWTKMLDEKSGRALINLYGHKGPVYRVSFATDHNMLASCSEDGTIRLWSLLIWSCIVVFKGHFAPVWSVCFSTPGYYFASCSYDKTARFWATDTSKSLRIFAGHIADVDCVQIHPNCNYVASGSSDTTVRLWDVSDGRCVRTMYGHDCAVHTLSFSNCGQLLASASLEGTIIVWDLANAQAAATLLQHKAAVHTMCFSRDGNILATGGNDCCLALWDFAKLISNHMTKSTNAHNKHEDLDVDMSKTDRRGSSKKQQEDDVDQSNANYLLAAYKSKSTPFYGLHFTRTNLLLATGAFIPNYVVDSRD